MIPRYPRRKSGSAHASLLLSFLTRVRRLAFASFGCPGFTTVSSISSPSNSFSACFKSLDYCNLCKAHDSKLRAGTGAPRAHVEITRLQREMRLQRKRPLPSRVGLRDVLQLVRARTAVINFRSVPGAQVPGARFPADHTDQPDDRERLDRSGGCVSWP